MARKFFYVSLGVFLLALSYQMGARSATAQAQSSPIVAYLMENGSTPVVVTANGDTYAASYSDPVGLYTWYKTGNVFFKGPSPAAGAGEQAGGREARRK